jgi:hypothetical protein
MDRACNTRGEKRNTGRGVRTIDATMKRENNIALNLRVTVIHLSQDRK